ncbi:hypothetical protein D3C86_1281750 [compost metagenome]
MGLGEEQGACAVGGMPQDRLGQRKARFEGGEALELQLGVGGIRSLGGRQMAHEAHQLQVGRGERHPRERFGLMQRGPDAGHAGVDLEVNLGRAAELRGDRVELAQGLLGAHHHLKVGGDRRAVGVGNHQAEQQHGLGEAQRAQAQALGDGRDPQPVRPGPERGARDGHGPVAVAVGLDHRHQVGMRGDPGLEGADVGGDRAQVHLEPGAAHGSPLQVPVGERRRREFRMQAGWLVHPLIIAPALGRPQGANSSPPAA